MSGLDVFQNTERDALIDASRNIAPTLPAGFTEAMEEAWRTGREWSASNALGVARINALDEYLDGVRQKTGVLVPNPLRAQLGEDPSLDSMRQRLEELGQKNPGAGITPPSDEELDRLATERMRGARSDALAMAQREKTWGGTAGGVLGSLGAATLDPVNLALLPLGLGEAGILLRAGEFAAVGAGSQLANEFAAGGAREKAEPGYLASGEPFQNVAAAGLFGAVLGGGVGLLGRLLGRDVRPLPTTARDEVHAATSEAQVAATNPFVGTAGEMAHRDGLVAAVGQIARGEPITAGDGLAPDVAASFHDRIAPVLDARTRFAEGRLPPTMERLSEVQLGEFATTARQIEAEATAARERLAARGEKIAGETAAFPERQATVDQLRTEADGLRQELEARRGSVPPAKVDPETQARLQAIEEDLAGPAVTAERRAALEGERRQIEETLAAQSPEQASIRQEITWLERALARTEKRLAKAEQGLARARERTGRASEALDRQTAALEARRGGQLDSVSNELRRSIARLAQEGYGLRLAREDAETMAGRVLGATEEDLPAVLRSITEDLITRPRSAEDTLPRRQANSDYWKAAMSERVQEVVRGLGHDMPDADARALAEQLAGMSESDVIRTLAEMTQRPITIAERPDVGPELAAPPADAPLRRGQAALRSAPDLLGIAARDGDAAEKLRNSPDVQQAAIADLQQILRDRPASEFRTVVQQPDGTLRVDIRPLADVLDELDVLERASKDLAACVLGEAAE